MLRCTHCGKRIRRNTHVGPLWIGVHLRWFEGQHCALGLAPNFNHQP